MRILITAFLLAFSFAAFSQGSYPTDTTQMYKSRDYGWIHKRLLARVQLLPTDTVFNKTGLAAIGTSLYLGNGTRWFAISGGGGGGSTDTTSLSSRINLKLNIADTASKWVGNIQVLNDSTIRVYEGASFTDLQILGKANNSGTTETASNGLAKTLSNIKLGGPLTEATSIDNSSFPLNIGQNYFSNTYNFLPFADATNTMAAFQNSGTYEIFSQKTSDRVAGFGYSNSTVSVNGAAKQVLIGSYMPFTFGPPAPALDDSLSSFLQIVPSLVNITARQTTINGLYANINAFTNFLPEETDSVLALPSYKRLQGMQWYDAARRTPKYWGGVRAENSNHVIFVENLQGYATDNEKLQAAINFATEGDIVLLEDGKTYNIDKGLSIPRSMVIRGGNKTVLKRENQITYTLVQAASQNDTVIRVNSIAGLYVGMPFSLAADTTYKGTTYPYYIERLAADSVYLSDSIGTTVNGNTTYPIGTKGYKSIVFMEITEASQQGSLSVTVENIIFDGNRDNNRGTYLWNHNMGIVASSKGITYIKNSTFKNSPSESLLGANLNVTGTKFYNLNGSGIHLSFAASQNMGREFRSTITGNTFDSTNKYPSFTIGGHSEGVITSSNSGAYAYIAGNVFKNVLNDALFGALYGATHADNMGTNNLTITGNIVDNVPKLVYLVDTVSGVIDNVYIKGNQINNLGTYVDYNEWLPRLQPKVIIDQYNKDTIWRSGANVYARRNSLTYLEHTDSIGLTSNQTITLTGAVTGTGATLINTVYDTTDVSLKALVRSLISDSTKEMVVRTPLQFSDGVGSAPDTLRADTTTSAGVATKTNLNLKQNLVTLTTTGSSGAATFNQSTGALNIPNYAGGGGGTWGSITGTLSSQTDLQNALNLKASVDSLNDRYSRTQQVSDSSYRIIKQNGKSTLYVYERNINNVTANAAGSTTQIQYNLAGVTSADAGLTFDPATQKLSMLGQNAEILLKSITTEPAQPADSQLHVYAKTIAGKPELKIKGGGLEYPLQSALWMTTTTEWANTTATAGVWKNTAGTGAGTFAAVTPTDVNIYTSMKRSRYGNVVTTTNQVLGQRNTENIFFRGSAVSGAGGFRAVARGGMEIWTNGGRFFFGMATANTVITADPSALNNTVGFSVDVADNGLIHFITKNTGTVQKVSTGYTFANNTGFDFYIFCAPGSSQYSWRIVSLQDGTEANGVATLQLPVNTTKLSVNFLASNAALTAANAVQLGLQKIWVETDF